MPDENEVLGLGACKTWWHTLQHARNRECHDWQPLVPSVAQPEPEKSKEVMPNEPLRRTTVVTGADRADNESGAASDAPVSAEQWMNDAALGIIAVDLNRSDCSQLMVEDVIEIIASAYHAHAIAAAGTPWACSFCHQLQGHTATCWTVKISERAETAERDLAAARAQLEGLPKAIDRLRLELDTARADMAAAREEIERLRKELQFLADKDPDCSCDDHKSADCCCEVDVFCARCTASRALSVPEVRPNE